MKMKRMPITAFVALVFCFAFSVNVEAQLSPINVESSTTQSTNPYDATESGYTMDITVDFNSTSELGGLIITVFKADNEEVVAYLKASKSELQAQSQLIDDTVSIQFFVRGPATGYRIETQVITDKGAYKAPIITNHNI